MSECARAGGSGRVELKMAPSLPLLSCESSVSVKENPDREKKNTLKLLLILDRDNQHTQKGLENPN